MHKNGTKCLNFSTKCILLSPREELMRYRFSTRSLSSLLLVRRSHSSQTVTKRMTRRTKPHTAKMLKPPIVSVNCSKTFLAGSFEITVVFCLLNPPLGESVIKVGRMEGLKEGGFFGIAFIRVYPSLRQGITKG